MAKFTKQKIEELIGGDMNSTGNDKPYNNDSEIETGPVQKAYNDNSDYKKGVSTTTDTVTNFYTQDIPWFAVYSYAGTHNKTGNVTSESKRVISKNKVEEKVNDLVKKTISPDITDKNTNPKVSKLLNTIINSDLTDSELESLEKTIKDKLRVKK